MHNRLRILCSRSIAQMFLPCHTLNHFLQRTKIFPNSRQLYS